VQETLGVSELEGIGINTGNAMSGESEVDARNCG